MSQYAERRQEGQRRQHEHGIASDRFLTSDNLFNVGQQTAVIAIGMTLVIITAGIDLSVGAVAALAGCVGENLDDPEVQAVLKPSCENPPS